MNGRKIGAKLSPKKKKEISLEDEIAPGALDNAQDVSSNEESLSVVRSDELITPDLLSHRLLQSQLSNALLSLRELLDSPPLSPETPTRAPTNQEFESINTFDQILISRGIHPERLNMILQSELIPIGTGEEILFEQNGQTNGGASNNDNLSHCMQFIDIQKALKQNTKNICKTISEDMAGITKESLYKLYNYFRQQLNIISKTEENDLFSFEKIHLISLNLIHKIATGYFSSVPNFFPIYFKNSVLGNRTNSFIKNPSNIITQNVVKFIENNQQHDYLIAISRAAILESICCEIIKIYNSIVQKTLDISKSIQIDVIINNGNISYNNYIDNIVSESGFIRSDENAFFDATNKTIASQSSESKINLISFGNAVASLVSQMLMLDSTIDLSSITEDEADGQVISFGLTKNLNAGIKLLRKIQFRGCLSQGNRVFNLEPNTGLTTSNIENIFKATLGISSNSLNTENKKNATNELLSAIIFDQVVGANFSLQKNNLAMLKQLSPNVNLSKYNEVLFTFINKLLLSVETNVNSYGQAEIGVLNTYGINDLIIPEYGTDGSISNFNNAVSKMGKFITRQFSPVRINNTNNFYMPLETNAGINSIILENGFNLISAEDALIRNKISDGTFDFSIFQSFLSQYENDVKLLTKDIIDMYSINYDAEDENITNEEQLNISKENSIVSGLNPLTYLNNVFEALAEDLENLVNDTKPSACLGLFSILANSDTEGLINIFKSDFLGRLSVKESSFGAPAGIDSLKAAGNDDESNEAAENILLKESISASEQCAKKMLNLLGVSTSDLRSSEDSFAVDETVKFTTYITKNSDTITTNVDDFPNQKVIRLGKLLDESDLPNSFPMSDSITTNSQEVIKIADDADGGWPADPRTRLVFMSSIETLKGFRIGSNFVDKMIFGGFLNPIGNVLGDNNPLADVVFSDFEKNTLFFPNGNDLTRLTAREHPFYYGGIFGTSLIQRALVFYAWYVNFIKKTIGMSIEAHTFPGAGYFGSPTNRIQCCIDKEQIRGVAYALKGVSPVEVFVEAGNKSAPVLYFSYLNAKEQINQLKSVLSRRKNQIASTLNLFNKNVADIKIMLTRFNDIAINNPGEKKKNTAKNLMVESGISEKIINMSNTTAACFTNCFNDMFKINYNSFPLSLYDKEKEKDIKLMKKVLNTKGYNLTSSENLGKKVILNVGIPSRLIETLSKRSYAKTGDESYLNSSLIAIYVYRKNELNKDEHVYPRVFVYDASKIIKNAYFPESENNNETEIIIPNHIQNYSDSWNINNIVDNIEMVYPSKDANKIGFISSGIGLDNFNVNLTSSNNLTSTLNNYNNEFKKDVMKNHIFDYYLKLYQKTTLGFELENYNFLIDENKLFKGNFDSNIPIAVNYYNNIVNYLDVNYPSHNVDEEVDYEVKSLINTFKNTNFLSSYQKLNQTLTPSCYDRVISIPISERDFIINTNYYNIESREIFTSSPVLTVGAGTLVKPPRIGFMNSNQNKTIEKYLNSLINIDSAEIYKFHVSIGILKKW